MIGGEKARGFLEGWISRYLQFNVIKLNFTIFQIFIFISLFPLMLYLIILQKNSNLCSQHSHHGSWLKHNKDQIKGKQNIKGDEILRDH